MSKEMIEYKENFISKIKKFFKRLFGRNEYMQENIESKKELNKMEKNNFKESIEVKEDEEELKIIKLQTEYKAGNIREEDMTDEEHEKLIDLYKKQNKELKEKIETKKHKIRKKLDDLKTS